MICDGLDIIVRNNAFLKWNKNPKICTNFKILVDLQKIKSWW